MHSTLGASIYRLQSLGPENKAKNTDFENPRISTLVVLMPWLMSRHCYCDIVTSLLVSRLYVLHVCTVSWLMSRHHYDVVTDVTTLNFSFLITSANVVTLDPDVTALSVMSLHFSLDVAALSVMSQYCSPDVAILLLFCCFLLILASFL